MRTQIHRTLTDDEGHHYKIVPRWFMVSLTVLMIINLLGLLIVIAVIIDNTRQLDTNEAFKLQVAQRNRATSQMTLNRTHINQWMFNVVCQQERAKGNQCYENPQWWLDPDVYPLLRDDPNSVGLFAPKDTK